MAAGSLGRHAADFSRRIRVLVRTPAIGTSAPAPEIPKEDLPSATNGATVEALLDNLRRLVAYEEQRLNSLTTRGSALAGFSGVATAVIAAGSAQGLPVLVKFLLVMSAAGLVFVAGAVVLGMLATRTATIQSTTQVGLYREPGYQSVSPARVQVQMVDILIERLKELRVHNLERATWLNRSALGLVVAIFLAALAAVIKLFA